MKANETQVGGDHYKTGGEEHWDRVRRLDLDYFQGQITKYVERWKKKNGVEDLRKARHFLDKYIEIQETGQAELPLPAPNYPNYRTTPQFLKTNSDSDCSVRGVAAVEFEMRAGTWRVRCGARAIIHPQEPDTNRLYHGFVRTGDGDLAMQWTSQGKGPMSDGSMDLIKFVSPLSA